MGMIASVSCVDGRAVDFVFLWKKTTISTNKYPDIVRKCKHFRRKITPEKSPNRPQVATA